jgi:hypothetical protein
MVTAAARLAPFIADVVELDNYYTAFYQVEVPAGTSAIRAWRGRIQPYRSDDDARNLLAALENGRNISCDQGYLHGGAEDSERTAAHWAKPFLVSMAQKFEVLVLERPEPMHPVAFSLSPEISWYRFPGHPHLRTDIPLQYAGRTLHGLCVYSAADFAYTSNAPRIVQFADQVAAYLARHLVWERTRRLEDFAGHILHHPKAGEPILDTEPQMQPREALPLLKHPKRYPERVWRGHWPGQSAPAGPQNHLSTIKPNHACWCGSGKKYGQCHRESEVSSITCSHG